MNTGYEASQKSLDVQAALNRIATWLLKAVSAEPGWDELVLDIKPLAGSTMVRITEYRAGQSLVGSTGSLAEDSEVLADIAELQRATYDEVEGSWLTASVIVEAQGWPLPTYRLGASYNRHEDPQDWNGEGRLTAREIRQHLEAFPRAEGQVPEWALERMSGRRSPKKLIGENEVEVPNQYLVTALKNFNPDQLDLSVINILRTLLGGDVLLDISDSVFVPLGDSQLGPKSELNYQVLRLQDDMRALCVFSSSEHAAALRAQRGADGAPVLLRQSGVKMLMDFVADETCQLLALDFGSSQQCFIEKPQVQWVLSVPRHDGVKNALLKGSMELLESSLLAPGSILHFGAYPQDPYTPIFAEAEGRQDPDTVLFFTSAPEVSALDPLLHVQTLSTVDAFKLAVSLGVKQVRLNALNPSATLSISKVKEILARAEEAESALGR